MKALPTHRSGRRYFWTSRPTYRHSACCHLLTVGQATGAQVIKRNWPAALSAMVGSILVGCVMPPSQYYSSPYSRYYSPTASSSASTRYYSEPSRPVAPYRASYLPPSGSPPPPPVENTDVPIERSPPNTQVPGRRSAISDNTLSGKVAPVEPPSRPTASAPNAAPAGLEPQPPSAAEENAKENQTSRVVGPAEVDAQILNYEKQVTQNPRTELMKLGNAIVLNQMGSRGIALFANPGELSTSVPSLFAAALGDMAFEKKEILRSALVDPNLLDWARDMGKFVISYMPISPETSDANMKAFNEALPVLMNPLAHMPDSIEFDAWYAYSIKQVPVPQFWAEAYGKDSWNPTAVYVYAFLLRRETDQRDPTLKGDTVKAWQELIHGWADALALRIMSKTWVATRPPEKSGTTPVFVRVQ